MTALTGFFCKIMYGHSAGPKKKVTIRWPDYRGPHKVGFHSTYNLNDPRKEIAVTMWSGSVECNWVCVCAVQFKQFYNQPILKDY